MTNNRLAIIGAGELGIQVLHYAKLQGKFEVAGFIDDTKKKGELVQGIPVIGNIIDLENQDCDLDFDYLFVAIGYKHFKLRDELYSKFSSLGYKFATIISPNVWIDATAKIGQGCLLYPGATIDKDVIIEDNVIINLNATISHNSHIDKHSYISPCVAIAGYCCIGQRSMIGINASIIDHVAICDDVLIGAAALITKNIDQSGVYVSINSKLR